MEGARTVRVGYVRVSNVDQNTVRQLDGIAVERTFTDKASGKDTLRPKLDEMLAFVRDGDSVVVHSMDRLARNLDDLRRVVRSLTDKGVRVEFVKERLAFTGDDSPAATAKASAKTNPDGEPIRSFRGLLDHLATLTRNTTVFADRHLDVLVTPTPTQRRAFELINAPIPLTLTETPHHNPENG